MSTAPESFDRRLEATVELAISIASGDLSARLEVSERGDAIDAIATALNMLAEELSVERSSRQRAEELLRDEVEAYEYAPALFCSLNSDSLLIEKCNQRLAAALEMTKQEVLGRSVLDLYDPACREDAERSLRQLAAGAPPDGTELRLRKQSGGHIIVDISATRIRALDGSERLRIVWRDVSAEKQLEARFLQAQKMEAVGRLSGGVAHDFNNILAVIMGSAGFLEQLLIERNIASDDVRLIQEAAARGASLTNDLLAFSRRRIIKPVPIDLRTLVHEAERMARRLVGENIRVATHVAEHALTVVIDPSQFSQVLINLAINARDAMPEGGVLAIDASSIHVDLSQGAELDLAPGEYALISVSDTGIGMASHVAAQAFEPFFTTKPVGQGTGLGLSTSYGIVRQAGGRMWISSAINRGTSVKIYLPQVPVVTRAAHADLAPSAHLGRETLLVVEDDAAVRVLTMRILKSAGYRVLVAQNGEDALRVSAQFDGDIALMVTDVMMPEMGGSELALAMRESRPGTRVLFVSGYTANGVVKQGVLEAKLDFLGKPFTPAALLTTVRQILDRA
jgi:two-component system, cell cycle sensor histidine kinase and response regulator CckA